jgi:hypothetical protein
MPGPELNTGGRQVGADRLHRPDGEHRRQPPPGELNPASWWNAMLGHLNEHLSSASLRSERDAPGPDPDSPDDGHLDRLLDLAAQSWADGWIETNSGPPMRRPGGRPSRAESPATGPERPTGRVP